MDNLLHKNQQISIEEKAIMIQLLQNKLMRGQMTDILNEVNAPRQLLSPECLHQLADLLKFLLTRKLLILNQAVFTHEPVRDYRLQYTVMEASQNLFCLVDKRKQYLSALLCEHAVWQDAESWRACVAAIIALKSEDAQLRRKQLAKPGERGFFRKGFSSLKGLLAAGKPPDARASHNLVFNELSRFVQSSINLGLPLEQAQQLLLGFCDQYQVEQSRVHLLLTELQSNQRKAARVFSDKEQLIWSLQRRGHRLKAFGFSDTSQIVGMTIKFVASDEELRALLLLCRDFNDQFREEVLK